MKTQEKTLPAQFTFTSVAAAPEAAPVAPKSETVAFSLTGKGVTSFSIAW